MLKGIMTQCCFPQLSTVSREVHEQLKIDFLSALPTEISWRILGLLDTTSLCKAAQVSHRWRDLADDDVVWHRMCEQHIDRKCKKCGWGLPLLERKRLRECSRRTQNLDPVSDAPGGPLSPPDSQASIRRCAATDIETTSHKRLCVSKVSGEVMATKTKAQLAEERRYKPWKDVYRDRFKIGYNWRHGICSIKTFRGHTNGVTCLQFKDNILATGSYDATIKIWDTETGELLRNLTGHQTGIRSIHFNGSRLVSGSLDRSIRIWNWQTGEALSSLTPHSDGVISVHFEGDYQVSGSIDCTVRVFQFSKKTSWVLRGHKNWVNHVRVDTRSRVVYSASDDCTVKMWDLDTMQCFKTFEGHVGQVQQVVPMPEDFEPDLAASGNASDAASVDSGSAGPASLGAQHGAHENPADRACYGPFFADPNRPLPSRYILTAALDNLVQLWDTATGQRLMRFFGHLEGIWGLAADTLRAVTGANDGMVKVWDPRTGKCERTFTGHTGPVACIGLDDSRMASGGEDGEVRIYNFDGDWGISDVQTP